MTQREIREGDWTHRYDGRLWTSTHVDGQVIAPPAAQSITDIRRAVAGVSTSQYTVVGGPGRAISARRFTAKYQAA